MEQKTPQDQGLKTWTWGVAQSPSSWVKLQSTQSIQTKLPLTSKKVFHMCSFSFFLESKYQKNWKSPKHSPIPRVFHSFFLLVRSEMILSFWSHIPPFPDLQFHISILHLETRNTIQFQTWEIMVIQTELRSSFPFPLVGKTNPSRTLALYSWSFKENLLHRLKSLNPTHPPSPRVLRWISPLRNRSYAVRISPSLTKDTLNVKFKVESELTLSWRRKDQVSKVNLDCPEWCRTRLISPS